MSTITNNGTGSLDIPKSRSTLTQQSKKGERVQEISRGLKQLDDQDIDEVEHRLRRSFDMETKYGPLSTYMSRTSKRCGENNSYASFRLLQVD